MKEPKKIKLNPETPVIKEPIRYRLLPVDNKEFEISGQDNDDTYISLDLTTFNRSLNEDNSENN
jgi:hypothetical protein